MTSETHFRRCSRCIMDTTDPNIRFDSDGVCNHCHEYERLTNRLLMDEQTRDWERRRLVEEIKRTGQGKPYDCVLGISGGVDSSYVALLATDLGLRPLAVHVDNGWNDETANHNMQSLLEALNIDLHTVAPDWDSFRDLQVAFLLASTPDSEIPTDHAIVASLYQVAAKHGIRHVLAGYNVRTEGVLPTVWSQGHYDWRYIRGVHRAFGTRPLNDFPHYGLCKMLYFFLCKKLKQINLLNYVDYNKDEAKARLQQELGWRDYSGKHHESIYTRFLQGYILPTKFGFDKRKAHLSALILSGQLSRHDALAELKKPPYPVDEMQADRQRVIEKFALTEEEFERIIAQPPKSYHDYPSYQSNSFHRALFWGFQRLPKLGGYVRWKLRGGAVSAGSASS